MSNFWAAKLAFAAAVFTGLQACTAEPTGQVIAIVNGEEITQGELNAELRDLSDASVGDEASVRERILGGIVDRRLMAQLAKADGVDRDPVFLVRERKLREELLVQMYGQKQAEAIGVPDAVAVEKYISENSARFSDRKAYLVDQVVFEYSDDPALLDALQEDKTLAEVEATLSSFDIEFDKSPNQIDALTVPSDVLKQILALPEGEPFVVPQQGMLTVSVITGVAPIESNEEDLAPFAAREMRSTEIRELLRKRVETARAKADIKYQPGFEPTKPIEALPEPE